MGLSVQAPGGQAPSLLQKYVHAIVATDSDVPPTTSGQANAEIGNAMKNHKEQSKWLLALALNPLTAPMAIFASTLCRKNPDAYVAKTLFPDFFDRPNAAGQAQNQQAVAHATPNTTQQTAANTTTAAQRPKPQAAPQHFISFNDIGQGKTVNHQSEKHAKTKKHEKLSYGLA